MLSVKCRSAGQEHGLIGHAVPNHVMVGFEVADACRVKIASGRHKSPAMRRNAIRLLAQFRTRTSLSNRTTAPPLRRLVTAVRNRLSLVTAPRGRHGLRALEHVARDAKHELAHRKANVVAFLLRSAIHSLVALTEVGAHGVNAAKHAAKGTKPEPVRIPNRASEGSTAKASQQRSATKASAAL